jgi:DNA-binding NarL/FixJ family response regulator
MPGVDGAVLTRLLKKVHGADVRVLLYSGRGDRDLETLATTCGADGYVSKQSPHATLLARVREALDKGKS